MKQKDGAQNDENIVHAAACVLADSEGLVLIAERPPHKDIMPGYWEFPGGKLMQGETPEAALRREIAEEIGVTPVRFAPLTFISEARRDARLGAYHVIVYVFLCRDWKGKPESREGQALAWARPDELLHWKLLPSNIPLVPVIRAAVMKDDFTHRP